MRKVYQCEHTVPPVWWFTFTDRNALGEEILVEFRKSENTYGKHSLPAMRKRKDLIDKEPETWWGVQTYVTDRQSRCSGKYNPTTRDGKLNFEWLLEEYHRIFDDKSGRNEMLAQKASELFEEE